MTRQTRVVPFETKAVSEAERSFAGYGSVFGTLDSYDDIVEAGAFAASLQGGRMPAMLWQHDPSVPVGVWTDVREDETGLFVSGRLSDTQAGRDAYTLLKDGALTGLSIGFSVEKDGQRVENGVRYLTRLKLWEVSLVTFPANDPARVSLVKADDLPTEREFEQFLRDAGLTRNQAKSIISKGYRETRRDAMSSVEACEELLALVKQRTAIFTGDRHGTAGSQEGARRE